MIAACFTTGLGAMVVTIVAVIASKLFASGSDDSESGSSRPSPEETTYEDSPADRGPSPNAAAGADEQYWREQHEEGSKG